MLVISVSLNHSGNMRKISKWNRVVPKGLLFTFNGKNARFPRCSCKKHTGKYLYTWRNLFQLDFCLNYRVFCANVCNIMVGWQLKIFPKNCWKSKDENLCHKSIQITSTIWQPNTRVHHSKVSITISFVPEFKSTVSFSLVVHRGFLAIIIGLVGGILVVFSNIEAVLFTVIDSPYEDHLCLWQLCFIAKFIWNRGVDITADLSVLVLADIGKLDLSSSRKTAFSSHILLIKLKVCFC